MMIIDTKHSFYRPLWVRVLIVSFCAFWCGVEFYNHEPFWGTVVGGIAVYAAYVLLITFKPSDDDAAKTENRPEA
jgi:hypothetical protein